MIDKKNLVIATHNQGKLREFKELLIKSDCHIMAAKDFAIPEPNETGNTFIANAELKTTTVKNWFLQHDKNNLPHFILADDSGIEITALHGAPGIFSARWAGRDKNFNIAIERVKQELLKKNIAPEKLMAPLLSANFSCALSLFVSAQNKTLSVLGVANGFLKFPPSGHQGFGYDSIFVPQPEMIGQKRTFANMTTAEKDKISHRTHALKLLLDVCQKENIDFTLPDF
ncbi:MAG: non-canonical purine NTP pyrophosphatase [Alphaproteobacteria bacterium]